MFRPLALAILLCLPAVASQAKAPGSEDLSRYAERLLDASFRDDGPGAAVLVAQGERVLYRGAQGMASIELGVALTPDHVFRIGSVTKQFAAATLLRLIDQGKARLDDPLSKFLPDYPNGSAITLHQLLNHTSGVRSYTGMPGYMTEGVRRDLDTAALVAVFKDEPVDFAPGQGWAYNNSGYVLVGAVIEAIGGQSWDAVMAAAVLQPAGLAQTRLGDDRAVIARHAAGYHLLPDGQVARPMPLSMTQPHAAGALVSTLDDLWRWNRALHGGQLLAPASYQRMITPADKAAEPPQRYGYGIERGSLRGRTLLQHGGGIPGFISTLMYLPEPDLSVAVLRNADGAGVSPDLIARRLAAVALGDPYPDAVPVAMDAAALRAFEGVYRQDAENARALRVVDGTLTSQRTGGPRFALIPIGEDRFLFENSLSLIAFQRGEDERVQAMRFYAEGEEPAEVWPLSGEPLVAERTALDLPRPALERLLGEYASAQLGVRVFFDEAGVLQVQAAGQPALALKAETPNRFFVTEVDASFEFEPADGPAQKVTLVQGPARIEMPRKQP